MDMLAGLGGLIVNFLAFFICLSVHEASHAWAANKLGDPTSKYEGRLSLNPIRHIDLFGTVLLPLFLILSGLPAFGYAKPVLVDPRNFANFKKDMYITALAGPGSNLLFALIIGILISAFPALEFLSILIYINLALAFFNLIPIPPLDGSKVLQFFVSEEVYESLTRYGYFILIALIFLTPVFDYLFTIVYSISNILTNLF